MKFEIRTFRSGDENQLNSLWNRTLPEDGRTPSLFVKEILLDENFSPERVFLAFAGERLIGAAGGVKRRIAYGPAGLEQEKGWLLYFFVDENYRRNGTGSALLAAFENKMRTDHTKKISFSDYVPGYLLPGLDYQKYPEGLALLSSGGYTKTSAPVGMRKNLSGFKVDEQVTGLLEQRIDEGYSFRKPEEKDYFPLISFCRKEFSHDWERIIREAVFSEKAGGNINLAFSPGGEIIGFSCFGLVGSEPDRFGPFGVAADCRGLSIGRILLNKTLEDLVLCGFNKTFFLWTYEDDPAGSLYLKTGFGIFRRFYIMEKDL